MTPTSNSEARKRHEARTIRWRVICADGNFEDIPEAWDPAEIVRIYNIDRCGPHRVEEVPDE